MNQKVKLEQAALNYFVEAYNSLNSTHLQPKEHRDKPDFIAEDSDSNRTVGIEVTGLFYDEDEAKMLLGRSAKPIHSVMNSRELIMTLNKSLEDKAKKAQKYKFKDEMFLIVRVASPIFDQSTFDMFERDIIIPSSIFSEIWLVFYNSSKQAWDDLKRLK